MVDQDDPARSPASTPGSAQGKPKPAPTQERDFGDSAGYGSGGSALDYHDVGDDAASPLKGKRNPLDDVLHPPKT